MKRMKMKMPCYNAFFNINICMNNYLVSLSMLLNLKVHVQTCIQVIIIQ